MAGKPPVLGTSNDRLLITATISAIGLVLVVVGLLWPWLSKLGLGRLPGDFRFRWRGREWHLPIASSLVLSLIAMAIGALL